MKRDQDIERIQIGRVVFIIQGKLLVGYEFKSKDGLPFCVGVRTYIRPDNRSFFIKTMMLYDEGFLDEIQELFKMFGYDVTKEELEKSYKEAKEYVEYQREKWRRIKRAWGIPDFF